MKIDLKNIFKKQPVSIFSLKNKPWPGPVERDWKIMVYTFAVGLALLSLFAWKIYLSDKLADGYFAPEATSVDITVKTLDMKRLKTDLSVMQKKQEAYNKQKTTLTKSADPAL